MNRPIYIFTGLIDSGKTTSIKRTIDDPNFTEKEKTLILCFEEGDEEYDEAFLKRNNCVVEYLDFKEFNALTLNQLDVKHHPDRVFIEFNGMDDDKELFKERFNGFDVAQIVCFIDASKFKLHIANMPQFMFNHVSISDIVVFHNYEGLDPKYLRANVKSMNQSVYLNLENKDGQLFEFPKVNIFDVDNLVIKDEDYGLFYIDVSENFDSYKDKVVEFNGFYYEDKNNFGIFGREAMVCCANDIQRLAIRVKDLDPNLKKNEYYHIKGIIRVIKTPESINLIIDGISATQIEKPSQEYVNFN